MWSSGEKRSPHVPILAGSNPHQCTPLMLPIGKLWKLLKNPQVERKIPKGWIDHRVVPAKGLLGLPDNIIHLTELAIPYLEKTKGNIINVSSALSQKTNQMSPFYAISKAALDHFARNYASLLASKSIRVNNLNPGVTETAFASRHGVTAEMRQKMIKLFPIPLNRWGTSEEMAEFLCFMASEKASYLTGQCINVEGGILIDSPTIKFD
uniref:SDR family oxidoreductase n=1 Tax=Panagrolaimus superbus TaxID=310955 RepID=A0A914YJG8_9BILA